MPGCDKPTGGKTMHDTLIIKRINYRYFDIPLRRGSGETTARIDKETTGQPNGRTAERLTVLPDKRTDDWLNSQTAK
ncbi:hypothetical protein HMPREF9442_02922 [Paraprevotella xylaniphila YIT 11841]|uniref:Uncharacterized protein n=1 Tax=Paraprevotella xylaniphila YIT 11841 TaxID=762982 RepID=F3QXI6_9BACT|nr:hypothetical protein HMPREF9442_02922 [Paraprevotella xylaniphila YIT 11841]